MQQSGSSGYPPQKPKRHRKSKSTQPDGSNPNYYQKHQQLINPLQLSINSSVNNNYPNYMQQNSSTAVTAPSGFSSSSVFDPGAFQGNQNQNSHLLLTPEESYNYNHQYSQSYDSRLQNTISQPLISPTFSVNYTQNDGRNENDILRSTQFSMNRQQTPMSMPPDYNECINVFPSTNTLPRRQSRSKSASTPSGTSTSSSSKQLSNPRPIESTSSGKLFICPYCQKQT
ncbi:unnamed protein product [Ambrosiozyma monospora]|uniref:Unnamed protein product n=1 Tax=Ambrosiozyma monospora TaxID=43982 RepID=A0ACB5TYA5_AMBMO|nr:unnamed protein product [Ambrosiozyma monospora]